MMVPAAASILTSFLVVLVLMQTANSNPVCSHNCRPANHFQESCFRHVSDLKDSSISPWTLKMRPGSEHANIEQAVCSTCGDNNLVAKPINIEVYVFQRVRNGTENHWCACPVEVSVGCTCVKIKKE